jgi:hypothetical protein
VIGHYSYVRCQRSVSVSQYFTYSPCYVWYLSKTTAPWGKTIPNTQSMIHQLLGPAVPPKLSWFIMESPNLIWCIVLLYYNNNYKDYNNHSSTASNNVTVAHTILLGMFFTHYMYRAIIYPYRMSHRTTRIPIGVVLMAFTFCTVNG